MNYLTPAGPLAASITPLLWGLIVLSVVVVVIVSVLVIVGVLRGRRHDPTNSTLPPVERPRQGVAWIYWGVGLSTLTLAGFAGWTVTTMAAIQDPPQPTALTVRIEAQQWWWSLQYDRGNPAQTLRTANEIHVPVGVPVHLEITSKDVIHSFWVPMLGNKTDAIPGRVNESWIQADKPGRYRGQCVEYCGLEHALMALVLVADPPEQFEQWWSNQLAAAYPGTAQQSAEGERAFVLRCGACHTVRGTNAGGEVGPDLTHLMSRSTIASGVLENTPANLSGWIADPQGLKPGSKMPNLELSGPELQAIRTFLETLS